MLQGAAKPAIRAGQLCVRISVAQRSNSYLASTATQYLACYVIPKVDEKSRLMALLT